MNNLYNEACRLIGRSRRESMCYMTVYLATAGLYILMCRLLGLDGAYGGVEILKTSPVKGLVAYLPGIVVGAWFAAGLAGRYTIDALTGAPEGMACYANGWFLRKLAADSLITGAMWVPVLFIVPVSFIRVVFAAMWIFAAAWMGLRIAFWLNISIVENLSLIESMKRSYALTRGQALRLLILAGVPRVSVSILSWAIGKVLPGQAALMYYIKAMLEGAAMMFITGVVVALYIELRMDGSKNALVEAVPAATGPRAE